MSFAIRLNPAPKGKGNLYVYYVYDSDKYEHNKVTMNEAVAEVFVTVNCLGQHLESINVLKREIIKEMEVLNLAKQSIGNLIVDNNYLY